MQEVTRARRCRLLELAPGEVAPADVAPPAYFISHCWKNRAVRMFDYVLTYLQHADEDVAVWIDILAVNQHAGTQVRWWLGCSNKGRVAGEEAGGVAGGRGRCRQACGGAGMQAGGHATCGEEGGRHDSAMHPTALSRNPPGLVWAGIYNPPYSLGTGVKTPHHHHPTPYRLSSTT